MRGWVMRVTRNGEGAVLVDASGEGGETRG